MLEAVLTLFAFLLGFVVGFVIGRWWALLGAVGVGVYVELVTDIGEVPSGYLGLSFALFAGGGIALGVLLRQPRARRPRA
jgi:hypothetical protein